MFAKIQLLPALVACAAVACSGGAQPGASAAGTAGSAAGGGARGGAGSSSSGAAIDDGSPIYPPKLSITPRVGINSVFNVIALTLRPREGGVDLLAAVRNEGDILACNASFSAELHDRNDEIAAASISGLMVRRFYELNDGSGQIAGCLAPGDVTMVVIPNMTLDPPTAEVESVVYYSNYWGNLDVSPVAGVSLSGVQAQTRSTGLTFSGTLRNELTRELENPTVVVCTLNAAGRPLDVAYGAASVVLAPGGSWDFETSAVRQSGVQFEAYPMGGS